MDIQQVASLAYQDLDCVLPDIDPVDTVALLASSTIAQTQIASLLPPVDLVPRVEMELRKLHEHVRTEERVLLEVVARTGGVACQAFHTGEELLVRLALLQSLRL